jgi:integrase
LVWQAFAAEAGIFGPLLKLLLLTGQRRGEVAGMLWSELRDLSSPDAIWEIPGTRTKNHRNHLVPLSQASLLVLSDLPRIGPFVFSTTGVTPVSGFGKVKARLDTWIQSKDRSFKPWTLHDLRRTLVTGMNDRLGIQPHVVEAIVNHISGDAKRGVAGVYNRALYLDERRRALEAWGTFVLGLVERNARRKPRSKN